MKKSVILLFTLLSTNLLSAQEKALKLVHSEKSKTIVLAQNKRIKIQTESGEKISGRFTITEDDSLLINGQPFAFSEIHSIKRHPLTTRILTGGTLIYAGALSLGFGAIITAIGEPAGLLLFIPGGALIYTGSKFPNLHRKYKIDRGWMITPVTISP